jgi:hypothetical protein
MFTRNDPIPDPLDALRNRLWLALSPWPTGETPGVAERSASLKLTGHLTCYDDRVLFWPANEGNTLLADLNTEAAVPASALAQLPARRVSRTEPDSFFALSVVLPGVLGLQVPPDDNPAVWVNAAYAFNATGGEILCEASGSLNTGSGATGQGSIAYSWGVVVGHRTAD